MIALLRFVLGILASPFKSKLRLQAENAVLRLKPALRLERRGQHGQNKTDNAIIAPT
jgi:hypothetical protein